MKKILHAVEFSLLLQPLLSHKKNMSCIKDCVSKKKDMDMILDHDLSNGLELASSKGTLISQFFSQLQKCNSEMLVIVSP